MEVLRVCVVLAGFLCLAAAKASNKLNIPGKKLVLEIDGTEVDNDTLQYFYQETLIILKENEMWEPMSILPSECSPSTSSSTISVPSILGNDLLIMDYQQTSIPQTSIAQATIAHTTIPQTSIAQTEIPQTPIPQISPQLITISEDYWITYSIPWQDMHRDIITLCEQGVTNKCVVNRVIDFVINEIRKIKENIPTKCLKLIARKMVDKYPTMLKDVDDDGVVLGDGTHSTLHKLIDRNNYLNRPHKRSLINNIVSSPTNIKIRKKMLSAKAGCSNWQPTEIDQTEDNLDDIQKLLRVQSKSLTYSKEEEETIISNLEKTYAIQRQFLNEVDSSSISNVMEEWPILLQEKFLFWHYEKLMNHSISNLTNNLLRKQRKIILFAENKKLTNLKANDDTDPEETSIECIKIACKYFKEDFTFFMKTIEEGVALNVAEPPSASPSILYFVSVRVECDKDEMYIALDNTNQVKNVYLKDLKNYPDEDCMFKQSESGSLRFIGLSIIDKNIFKCGITRVTNKITGKRVYYHTVVIEAAVDASGAETVTREVVHVKCSPDARNHTVVRRNVLPAGFQEPENLEIVTIFEEKAPKPELGVGVRQNGQLVTGELNVSPGTPLQMEIFLDKSSASIYGLLVTHMQVTDTKTQEETIIFNGCSVDPYLFENFNTVDGDFLTAKFRAFKFPESTYVQFRGTVNVCLDKCKGIECSDGVVGYGRKKRAIPSLPPDPNKVFEITITSFIKVNYEDESENFEEILKNQTKQLKDKKLIVGNDMTEEDNQLSFKTPEDKPANLGKSVIEELQYTAIVAETSSANRAILATSLLLTALIAYFY